MPRFEPANTMVDHNLAYWVAFSNVPGIGPARLRELLQRFGDVQAAWSAPESELEDCLDRRTRQAFMHVRQELDPASALARLEGLGARAITPNSPDYPELLRQLDHPPYVLYVRGNLLPQDEWAVAIVGTRSPSAYGREVATTLARQLSEQGVTVVSGMARGIDALAHQATVEAGGRAIGILGCGIDVVYPPEHARLYASVESAGCLMSEFPLGTRPEGSNFPIRNRIISGLALATVVVEAGSKSGALITAHRAAEQGREVFAVPGNIFARNSQGTNRLIRDGAQPLLQIDDLLEALNLTRVVQQREARQIMPESDLEGRLLDQLSHEPLHVDDLGIALDLPPAEVSSTLTLMELKGMVRRTDGMRFARVHDAPRVYGVG
jgi:DNA processing protein